MSDIVERLAPCPFCGEVLRKVESWAKSFQPARLYHEYHHPDNGCVTVTGHPALFWAGPATDAPTFITAWNRRSDATITALREEVERLTRTVNQYAYERDKAREERDQAERRSEQFWRGQLTALRQRVGVKEIGRDHAALYERAVNAVRALDDYTNTNETEFTGWGDGAVPPRATFWRVKSGQALKALSELADMSAARAIVNEMETTK